jgi:hypothetical protein
MNPRSRGSTGGASGGSTGNLFSSPESRIAETNRRLLEEQNNKKTTALADSIEKLKMLSIDIKTETEEQNKLLGDMSGQMSTASTMLSDTMGSLGTMLSSGENKQVLFIIVAVVTMFVLIYTYLFKLPASKDVPLRL